MSKNFLRAEDRYQLRWAPVPKTVELEEYKIPMPIMPDEKLIKNYDKKSKDQYYTKEVIPDDIHTWKKTEIDEFAKSQWHRRLNGEWQFINGKPYYIPGGAIPFYDFWKLESGRPVQFRYSALTLHWLFYNLVERSDNIFGIYVLKTRRIGDTANFLYLLWERATRFHGVRSGLQSYNDTMAGKTFARLAKGARSMPFFFKPNRTGSDRDYLAYMSLSDIVTMKKLKEGDFLERLKKEKAENKEFLGSFIDYQPTTEGAYDGEQLFTVFMDEVLKFPVHRMDAVKQFNNLRRCLSLFGEDEIFGKGFVSSTVEKKEKKTAKADEGDMSTIEIGRHFWDNSDPKMLEDSPDGRTVTGLIRLFRGYQMAAKPDEYGFPQTERARKFRDAKMEKAVKYNQPELLTDIYRKEPATPDEALIEDNDACPLYPEICQARINQIKLGLDRNNEPIEGYKKPYTEGVLVWKNDKINTKVVFVPQKGGPWHISQLPLFPNQNDIRDVKMRDEFGNIVQKQAYVPRWGGLYRVGCDPISANPLLVTKGSKGAITVKRRLFAPHEDFKLEFDENTGLVKNSIGMQTNQFVADYVDRPYDPEMFFREIIKACWFFSAPVMLEMDKPEAMVYMRKNGYAGMIMYEPPQIAHMRKRKVNSYYPGVRSQGDVVGMGVTRLKTYIANYWHLINHPRLLADFARFVPKKRTKFDLTVSAYMCEIAEMEYRYTLPGDAREETEQKSWASNPYESIEEIF